MNRLHTGTAKLAAGGGARPCDTDAFKAAQVSAAEPLQLKDGSDQRDRRACCSAAPAVATPAESKPPTSSLTSPSRKASCPGSRISFCISIKYRKGNQEFGATSYWILFGIVFCEPGWWSGRFCQVTRLLFAVGAICALPVRRSISDFVFRIVIAAVLATP